MHFVYFLRSIEKPDEVYTGMSNNPIRRRYEHNSHDDRNAHTFKFRPWKLESFIVTDNKETAEIAEQYFKNSSGREKFKNLLEQNPDSKNPINDYFSSLPVGKGFGKRANGTRFKVVENDGVPIFAMA